MKRDLHSRMGMTGVTLLMAARAAQAVCAASPAAAVSFNETNSGLVMQGGEGYRVTSVHWDSVLRKGWAMVARCGHPEGPEMALPTHARTFVGESAVVAGAPLVVRAGDTVRLWRMENLLRIDVEAVAEESGGVGKSIRVRLVRASAEGQAGQMAGVVRGPSDVEMER